MYPGEPPQQRPETQFIVTQENVQPAMQNIQPGMQYAQPQYQQPVVYIPLNYTPEVNYRNWSYVALAVGIFVYGIFSVFGMESNSDVLMGLAGSACCSSFAVAAFLDAAFYKGKADWQLSVGQPSGGSTTGMIFDIIFGIIAALIAFFALLGLSL